MFAFVGTMMRSPFDVVLAPQEIPIGPPTEYHSAYLALMQTNRVALPGRQDGRLHEPVLRRRDELGRVRDQGRSLLYMISAVIGVVHPRFRVEQSIRFFLKWGLPVGVLAILTV